jgi:hypothetical protein
MGHLERRRTNVHAIEKSNHVEQKQKGQEPTRDAMPGTLSDVRRGPRMYGGFGSVRGWGHRKGVINSAVQSPAR